MDYQKQQVEVMKDANELQEIANKLQEERIQVIKTNNEVTSAHNTVMRLLTGAIVFLAIISAIISLVTNYNKTGRFEISSTSGITYILDTKTSELWVRSGGQSVCLGTNKNPKLEKPTKSENRQR